MATILICGFYGWSNSGDEGILHAIIDEIGEEHDYLIATNLPYTMAEDYRRKLFRICVREVRHLQDSRSDFDLMLLGGGGLKWGYGWPHAIVAFSAGKPVMNYGIGYNRYFFTPELGPLYREFLSRFGAITVRDEDSWRLLNEIGIQSTLTMCPAINLREERFDDCPKGMIAVCPRYEDNPISNEPQIQWLVNRLCEFPKDEIILVPMSPKNREGAEVDLALCKEISSRMGGLRIFPTDGYAPRRTKYLISQSKRVISGGRYHALVWAVAHGVDYEISPTARAYPKIPAFLEMSWKYGAKLKEMEKENGRIVRSLLNG